MEIPDYIIKGALAHMERVAACCKADRDDSRTANALRLLRRDISTIKRRLNDT